MQKIEIQITSEFKKKRLDKALTSLIDESLNISRSRIQNLIKDGSVSKLVQGSNAEQGGKAIINSDPSTELNGDELLQISIAPPKPTDIKPNDEIDIDIIYEDDDLLVINKQSGLTVHPGAGNYDDTLVNALIAKIGDSLSGINGEQRPGIVHRLDRDTSGLMLVAKNDNAHKFLAEAIEYREVKRVYHAFVWNCPRLGCGKVDRNIGRSPKDRKKMSVVKKSGKRAVTHYKILDKYHQGKFSLLECTLETGRTHQIRVHMEHLKMPLIGDQTYPGQPTYKKTLNLSASLNSYLDNFPRQALHSKYIEFEHPVSGEILSFESDYPSDINELKQKLSE